MVDNTKFSLKQFNRGKQVIFNGRTYTVEHVSISNSDLFVKLDGLAGLVNSDEVHCEPTLFSIEDKHNYD